MATRDQIEGAMAFLTAAYPSFNLADPTLEVYIQHLGDLEPMDLMEACGDIIEENKFFPTIAEIRENAEAKAFWRQQKLIAPIRAREQAQLEEARGEPGWSLQDHEKIAEIFAPARAHIKELQRKLR